MSKSPASVLVRVLSALPLAGKTFEVDSVLKLPTRVAKSLEPGGHIDPHPEAVEYALSRGAKVIEPRLDVPTRAQLDEALKGLPGQHTDADEVVTDMREFFGELFTAADEKVVRELVKKAD